MFRRPNPSSRRPTRRRRILQVLVCVIALGPMLVQGAGKQPKKTNGRYNVSVAGSCTGEGRATVRRGVVGFTANVTDESGNKGTLVGTGFAINGSHFSGPGLVMGRPALFWGRLDGYAGDKHFKGARLLCTYTEVGGDRTGRVAGVLR
jgi:hypothetical protein